MMTWLNISGCKTGWKIDRDVFQGGFVLRLSYVYTCGMPEARESKQFKLAAGSSLERL